MNLIASLITKTGKFTNEVSRAKAQAETERLMTLEETSQNVQKNARLREEIRVTMAKAKQEKSGSKKSGIYNAMAVLFTIVSFILSALGITGARQFQELIQDARSTIITLMLLSISFMLYVVSTQQNYLRTRFHIDHSRLKILQTVVVVISVIGNYIFLKDILDPKNAFDYFVTIVFSSVPDYVTIVFGGMAQNVKYSNNSYRVDTLAETPLQMLSQIIKKRLTMLLYKPYKNTIEKYMENCDFKLTEKMPVLLENKSVSDNHRLTDFSTVCNEIPVKKTVKKLTENEDKKTVKKNSNTYDNAVKKLTGLQQGDIVSRASLGLKCTAYEWEKVRAKLKENNLIFTDGTKSKKA